MNTRVGRWAARKKTATGVAVFKVVNAVRSMRPVEEDERDGLDMPQFGLLAYPEDALVQD